MPPRADDDDAAISLSSYQKMQQVATNTTEQPRRPMTTLSTSERKRRCLIITLITLCLTTIIAVYVWTVPTVTQEVETKRDHIKATKNKSSNTSLTAPADESSIVPGQEPAARGGSAAGPTDDARGQPGEKDDDEPPSLPNDPSSKGAKGFPVQMYDEDLDDDDITVTTNAVKALNHLNTRLDEQSRRMPEGCESTILLVRHCEKDGPLTTDEDGDEHCNYIGYERTNYLATLFAHDDATATARWPTPSKLFALTPDRGSHINYREWETLQPLSIATGIPIQAAVHPDFSAHYLQLLQMGRTCGRLTVVCWKHSFMVELMQALGCGVEHGCPDTYHEDEFDQVIQIKHVFRPVLAKQMGASQNASEAPPEVIEKPVGEMELKQSIEVDKKDAKKHNHKKNNHHRLLRQRQFSSSSSSSAKTGWHVYGTVSAQNFDPLAFSYRAGDYPVGGTAKAGRWQE